MKRKMLFIFLISPFFLFACGNSDGSEPATQCVITNCHGPSVTCGMGEAMMCTQEYQIGDQCRKYVSCEFKDGECQGVEAPKYQACVECVKTCQGKEAGEAFKCDEACRVSLG